MNKTACIFLATITAATNIAIGNASASNWVGHIGGRGAEVIYDVTETHDGSVCATGTFWSSAQFGDESDAVTLSTDQPQDMFVACYAKNGSLQFARSFGAGRGDEPRAIAAMSNGDLVVTGLFTKKLGTQENQVMTANGGADMFVTRLTSAGEQIWSRQLGGTLADGANAMAITPDGDILLAGSFEKTLRFPIGDKLSKVNSAGNRDAVILKLNAQGETLWVSRLGGKSYDEATAVTARPDGGVVVAGTFRKQMTVQNQVMTSRGYKDVFVMALNNDGAVEWIRQLGGKQQDTVLGVVTDSRGRIHIAGDFQNSLTLPDASELSSSGGTDAYVAHFDAHGKLLGADSFGGKLTDQVFALAIKADDSLLLTGHYQGKIDIAPGEEVVQLGAPSPGNSSAYLLELNADGQHVRSMMIGGIGMEMALGLSALADGGAAVVGLFNKDLTVADLEPLKNRGKTDAFVARVQLTQP